MQIHVDSRARRLVAVAGMVALTAVTAFVWWHASADATATAVVSSRDEPYRGVAGSAATAVAAEPASPPVQKAELNYALLDPAAFVRPPGRSGGNVSYGEAMLLIACETHRQTQGEFKSEANLSALKAADPSGQLLMRLQFENRVAELQCARYGEQDADRIPALMAAAAEQGEPRARSWLLERRVDRLIAKQRDDSLDDGERAAIRDEARSMLADARTLAAAGQRGAAIVASKLTSSDRFGLQNLPESATWLLVAVQVPGREFNPRPELFEDEIFRGMSADQVEQVKLQAFNTFQRCCDVATLDQSARNPFSP